MTTFIETLNHWGDHFLKFAWPMLWQSSLLIAVIFVLEFALRRKVRAAIRYALWLVVLVKLLLPPSLALPTSPTWWIHSSVPPPAKAPPVSFTVSYGDQVMPDFPLPPSPVIPPPRAPDMTFVAWALAASGVVSAGLLAWLLVRWRQINQKVRRATASEKLIPVLDEARRLTRLRPGIRLKLTEDSMSPAVCGLFRPVILLPQSLVDKLSAGQLRAVLLHEAIHLRRGDVWVNCAQALLQIVYWWHPLLWLANARIRRVREEAVDDAVMLALRDDAEIYAPTLLEVAKLAFNRPLASLGLVGILESRSALRQRIERLMNFNAPRKAGLTVVSILGILAFSAVALPMGEAPEKTNASTVSVSNSTIDTNALGRVFKAGTGANTLTGLLSDTNFRATVHALEQRTGTEASAEPEPVITGGRPVQHMSANYVLQQAQYTAVTNNGLHTSAGRETINRKLNSLRLGSVSWSNSLPLNEAIRYLAEQSRLLDPDKKGINFMFNPNVATSTTATNAAPETVDPNTINVKLVLNNISLHDLVDAVMMVADRPIKYSVEDYAVVISPKPSHEPLEMRVFKEPKVAVNFPITSFHGVVMGTNHIDFANTNLTAAEITTFFEPFGVHLDGPGKSVAFNGRLSLLSVKSTPTELDAVERILQILMRAPPQIHIKARFIEVPEGQVEAILKAGTAVDTKQTNVVEIIAADKMKSLLHQLESAHGVVALAEPEAVTVSSRPVQMRTRNSTVDLVPLLLEDGYSIDLTLVSQVLEFLGYDPVPVVPGYTPTSGGVSTLPTVLPHFASHSFATTVTIWDNQTVVLDDGDAPSINTTKNRLLIFVTTTIVDPAGNRVHSDDELRLMQEKAKRDIPPQPILPDANSRATLHALEQRTGVESLAEPEPVTPAEQGTDRINRMFVPERMNIPTTTTNANESGTLVQEGKLLYEMGKFDDAEAKLKAALARYPTNQAAQYYLKLVEQAHQAPKTQGPKINYPDLNSSPTNSNPQGTNLEMRVFKVDPLRFSNSTTPDTLGVEDLSKKLYVDLAAPGRSVAYNVGTGLLMVRATPSELNTIERAVQALNGVPPQIHIKARFIEMEQDNNPARGFDWYLGSFSNGPVVANGRGAPSPTTARTRISNTTVNAVAVPASDQSLTQGLRNTVPAPATVTGILTDPNFRVTLQALNSRSRPKLLAVPEWVTISGQETEMHSTVLQTVLTNINPLALKPPGVSSNELFLTEKVECGPVFDVVPIILSDGYTINLTTTASVTDFLGYDKSTKSVTVYIEGKKQTVAVPLPKFRTQKISTVVNLWDNQTLVMGGPVATAVQTTKNKAPLLGDLPLVGGLFRSQTENSVKKQLMVFVTATIIDPAGNRVHSDDQLPFNPSTIPPQPQMATPSR